MRDLLSLETQNSSERTVAHMRDVLTGRRRGLRAMLPLAGPALVVSVAYMDPGNFATNIQAGAGYGYGLLWVVVGACIVAMLFQFLSAKLGLVTGHNLAQVCRIFLPRWFVVVLWVISEIAAMATDLAEFMGGALAFSLLLHIPMLAGMSITAVLTYGLLLLQGRGFRPKEIAIGALVGLVGLSYLAQLLVAPVDWIAVLRQSIRPGASGSGALTVAVGIVGATVMPHALFLQSGLAGERIRPDSEAERKGLIRYARYDVFIALGMAGLVNLAMVIVAAATFHLWETRRARSGNAPTGPDTQARALGRICHGSCWQARACTDAGHTAVSGPCTRKYVIVFGGYGTIAEGPLRCGRRISFGNDEKAQQLASCWSSTKSAGAIAAMA